ncbi:MAG: FtsW/RodA/SpoVE family cell cycle protein, partial [Tissierellia bacterium]|nr:FtsW/RodA/SpoVE family cell cycle protein [Tissierellia bacterium]
YNAPTPFEFSIFKDFLSIIIGFTCMFIAYFIDFTIIGKYPKKIFFGLSAVLILLIFNKNQAYYASKFLSLSVTSSFMLLLFPTAFAGIIYTMRHKSYLGIIQAGIVFSIPAVICLNVWNVSSVIIYGISCLILLTMSILNGWLNVKKSNALLLVYGAVSFVFIFFIFYIIINKSYVFNRIQSVFNPTTDVHGSGWITIAVRNIISNAKFFGQSDLGEYTTIPLPSIHSDFCLTYLIHKLGWISFIVIMSIIIAFILRLFMLCEKQKSVLAKLVSTSILITFTMQVMVYVAYNLGFQLLSPLTLPFISYGGTSMIINMFLIGILLSVFNLGDLIRDNSAFNMKHNKFFEFADGKIIINLNAR